MHAVIRTGGKQYRVAEQDVIRIEKIVGDEGEVVLFGEVLAVGKELGTPVVSGASVAGRVIAQTRDGKIVILKKKRRKNYRRKQGPRQDLTIVRSEEVLTCGRNPSAAKKKAAKKSAAKAPKSEAEPKAEPEAPEPKAPKTEAKAEAEAEAPPRTEAPAAADTPMFERPDGEPDDLKKLPGVGPATEKKLNALGIATYAQIAALTAEEIAQVDAALKLKGKIEQDDWPALAKELALEIQGEG
ncbi:MAG: 50S ribosomal protein L21 [Rhodospirillaceae bacterium]|nr:50S ribosomal protein L21 [Rhodospirillaceae bacterium]